MIEARQQHTLSDPSVEHNSTASSHCINPGLRAAQNKDSIFCTHLVLPSRQGQKDQSFLPWRNSTKSRMCAEFGELTLVSKSASDTVRVMRISDDKEWPQTGQSDAQTMARNAQRRFLRTPPITWRIGTRQEMECRSQAHFDFEERERRSPNACCR
jgi:hypothetical protein